MSRLGVTLGAQLGGDLLCAVGEVEARERALEHGQRGLGLVEGDLVACLVDAEEAEVPVLPDFTVFRSVDGEGLVSGGGELLGVRVVQCERDGFSAEPVTDVVCVAVEEVDAKALVQQVLKILAEVG